MPISAPSIPGLPVAYGLCEALRARQVYWTEKESREAGMHFRQYLEPAPGEKVLLVDDILRSGKLLHEARALVESNGGQVVGVAVLLHQPTPRTLGFGSLPLYYLAQVEASYYADAATCALCKQGVPLERIGRGMSDWESKRRADLVEVARLGALRLGVLLLVVDDEVVHLLACRVLAFAG